MTLQTAAPAVAKPVPDPVRRRGALPLLAGVAVCLLPFLDPAGPGNTAPADVAIVAAIAAGLLWAAAEGLSVHVPYAWGMTGMVVGGAVAALLADAPLGSALVLCQDVLLLAWGTTVALGRHDVRVVAALPRAWCRFAPAYAAAGVAAYLLGVHALSGVTARDGVRAAYTFGDPNLAGNYLVVSLFVMAACRRPRSPALRGAGYLVLVAAIAFTGSNGALLTLAVGVVLAVTLGQFRHGALAGALTLCGLLIATALTVLVVVPRVDFAQLRAQAEDSVPLLRDSVGRSDSSSSERATLVHEGLALFMGGDVTGYGPARTKATLERTQAPYVKEAHNDYVATLVERGVVGALGLLVFGAAVVARSLRLLVRPLPAAYAALVPRPWLLVVVGPVMATAGAFYETLHFRHLWTWLGLLAALALATHDEQAKRSSR
ncbi:MAG: O-antigen ligase family protein [Nocardioidaceae bacterium]